MMLIKSKHAELLMVLFLILAAGVCGMSDYTLLAHWDFEGSAGATSVTDRVGGRVATIEGGASLDGLGGVSLAGGQSGQYIDLGTDLGQLIGSLTHYRIETTFKWNGASGGDWQKVWTFSQSGTTEFATLTFVTTNEGYTRYQYRRDASDTEANRSYGYSLSGSPMTIGIEYNPELGAGGYGAIRTFKDGNQEAYATQTRNVGLHMLGSTTRHYIGKSPYDGGNYIDGIIYDFKIYGTYQTTLPEPIAHWTFDGPAGSTTATELINNYHGEIHGGASLEGTGKVYLDGVDDYVSLPVGSVISGLNSFSMVAEIDWSGDGGAWQRAFSFGSDTANFMNLSFSHPLNDEVAFRVRTSAQSRYEELTYAQSDGSLCDSRYFAVTYDAAKNTARVYIDGHLLGENRFSELSPTSLGTPANNWLGKSQYTAGAYFKGYFKDFKIYNKTLTPQQVGALAGFEGTFEPQPAYRATDTALNPELCWDGDSPQFDIYFGEDRNDVLQADRTWPSGGVYKGRVSEKTFPISRLKAGTTYYWRVDAVYQNVPLPGKIWQFTTKPSGTPVKVMCFNVEYDPLMGVASLTNPDAWVYAWGTNRRDRVRDMILSESEAFGSAGPDILGVQEPLPHQVTWLKNALPQYSFYGVDRRDGNTNGGDCGIFWRTNRFTKTDSGTFWLSETPDVPGSQHPDAAFPRIASWVILHDSLNGKDYCVLNTHYDHASKEANRFSSHLVRDKIAQLADGLPLIIMGDLNTREDEWPYWILLDPQGVNFRLYDTYRSIYPRRRLDERTFSGLVGGNSGSRIDYVFFSEHFRVGAAAIEQKKVLGRYPSDHYPVTATLYVRDHHEYLPADINEDMVVDALDLSMIVSDWLKSGETVPADRIGLVGWWDFEGPAGGTTVPDLVGGHDAVIVGGATLDGTGRARLAGGQSGQYIDFGPALGNVIGELVDYTAIVDMDWNGAAGGTWQRLLTFSQDGTDAFANLTFVSSNEAYLRLQHRFDGTDESANAGTPDLKGRHQLAVTMNSQHGDHGAIQIYVDGVQRGFNTLQRRASLWLLGRTIRNYIGKSPYEGGNFFSGSIYDMKLYNRHLSGQEIADIYNGVVEDVYVPLQTSTNLYEGNDAVNFLDFAVFAEFWLDSL